MFIPLVITGCASTASSPPVEEAVGSSRTPPPASHPTGDAAQGALALLVRAGEDEAAGRLDRAAARLERALRIEPQDAYIWHRLAAVRLRQGRFQQVEGLAAKSNSLAGGQLSLQRANWQLIRDARRARGDDAGAAAAEARLQALGTP